MRAPLAAMALCLAACLKDAPLVVPDRVYDPETAIRQAKYAGLDSIEVLLIDTEDSGKVIALWRGAPDSTRRLPAHVAAEGEAFYYRVDGWRDGRGHCFSEVIRDGTSTVTRDTCVPRPKPRFRERSVDLDTSDGALWIEVPAGYAGSLLAFTPDPWVLLLEDTLYWENGTALAQASADLRILEPGRHRGVVHLRSREAIYDSVEVYRTSEGAVVFRQDTVRFGNSDTRKEVEVLIPVTANPGWMGPSSAAWLTAFLNTSLHGKPGEIALLDLQVDRSRAPSPQGRFTTVLHAVGKDGKPFDTLVVVLDSDLWPGGVHGKVKGWDANQPVADAEIELLAAGAAEGPRTRTDSAGAYAFPSLRPGEYRLVATSAGRLGSVAEIAVGGSDTAADLRISPRYAVTTLDLEAGTDRPGSIAVVDGFAVLPRIAAGPDGKITGFSVVNVAGRKIATEPVARADSTPLPSGEAAEAAGSATRLFLSYPFDSTLAMATDWKNPGKPVFTFKKVGFRPYGLLLDGETLVCAGILLPGRIVVARFQLPDLVPGRRDTLTASLPDLSARDSLSSGPRLALLHDHYFVTEGDAPKGPGEGRIHLVHRTQAQPLPAPAWMANLEGVNDALVHEGWLYLAGGNSFRSGLNVGLLNGKLGTVFQAQQRVPRLAAARFSVAPVAYLAAATVADTILVFSPLHHRPVGKIVLPTGGRGRSVAIHGNTGRILIGDGRKVYLAGPEEAGQPSRSPRAAAPAR